MQRGTLANQRRLTLRETRLRGSSDLHHDFELTVFYARQRRQRPVRDKRLQLSQHRLGGTQRRVLSQHLKLIGAVVGPQIQGAQLHIPAVAHRLPALCLRLCAACLDAFWLPSLNAFADFFATSTAFSACFATTVNRFTSACKTAICAPYA